MNRALHTPVNLADPALMNTTKTSNSFSMLGTLFLWVFWPSFMASGGLKGVETLCLRENEGFCLSYLLSGLPQQRAMMNTYSSIIASVVATFAVSALSNKEGKLHIDHIQNAVLAGGVSIG